MLEKVDKSVISVHIEHRRATVSSVIGSNYRLMSLCANMGCLLLDNAVYRFHTVS